MDDLEAPPSQETFKYVALKIYSLAVVDLKRLSRACSTRPALVPWDPCGKVCVGHRIRFQLDLSHMFKQEDDGDDGDSLMLAKISGGTKRQKSGKIQQPRHERQRNPLQTGPEGIVHFQSPGGEEQSCRREAERSDECQMVTSVACP